MRKIGGQLLDLHSQLGQLAGSLQEGTAQRESKRNDLLLQIENLERQRNKVVKLPRTDPSLADPSNLIAALPDDVAFVDLVRYEDLAIHPIPQRATSLLWSSREKPPNGFILGLPARLTTRSIPGILPDHSIWQSTSGSLAANQQLQKNAWRR